jgi:MFS family permease
MGSSRRILGHDRVCNSRVDSYGIMQQLGNFLCGTGMLATTPGGSRILNFQVFYSIGFGGMIYSVDVITADATKLKNRALAFAFTSSPYMITAFGGPKASEGFYDHISWRWGFGAFSIILPFVAAPLFINLKLNLRKAEKQGIIIRRQTDRTLLQSILHYTMEFDRMHNHPPDFYDTNLYSSWSVPLRRWPCGLPSSILIGRLRSQRMEHRLYHCNDRCRDHCFGRFRPL